MNDSNVETDYSNYLRKLLEMKGSVAHFWCAPDLWREFQKAVKSDDPLQSRSQVLRKLMVSFIQYALQDRSQIKITQYFINKPQVVNIEPKAVTSDPLPDFSEMSLEELQDRYDKAVGPQDYPRRMVLAYELKKRKNVEEF